MQAGFQKLVLDLQLCFEQDADALPTKLQKRHMVPSRTRSAGHIAISACISGTSVQFRICPTSTNRLFNSFNIYSLIAHATTPCLVHLHQEGHKHNIRVCMYLQLLVKTPVCVTFWTAHLQSSPASSLRATSLTLNRTKAGPAVRQSLPSRLAALAALSPPVFQPSPKSKVMLINQLVY